MTFGKSVNCVCGYRLDFLIYAKKANKNLIKNLYLKNINYKTIYSLGPYIQSQIVIFYC